MSPVMTSRSQYHSNLLSSLCPPRVGKVVVIVPFLRVSHFQLRNRSERISWAAKVEMAR